MKTKIKLNELQIDEQSPWKNDLLDREKEIISLTRVISNIEPPFVMSINSNWGRGKTTFIRLWESHLKFTEIDSIYFNAWETDFSDEPLISFLGEINEKMSKILKGDSALAEKWEKTKQLGASISRKSLPGIIKIMTSGLINIENVDVKDFFSGLTENIASESLSGYLEKKTEIIKFKENIESIIEEGLGDKLVIFVDELDRCRPDYAIELLERIKHLFNVDGLVFVLSVAKEQLVSSIMKIYGSQIDAEEYLKKFIDIEYTLTDPPKSKFIDGLLKSYGIDVLALESLYKPDDARQEIESAKKVLLAATDYKKSSLRDISQTIGSINVAIRSAENFDDIPFALLFFLVFLKINETDLYDELRKCGMSANFTKYFDHAYRQDDCAENARNFIESQYYSVLGSMKVRPEKIQDYYNSVHHDNRSINPGLYDFKRSVVVMYEKDVQKFKDLDIDSIYRMVEFSSHFD